MCSWTLEHSSFLSHLLNEVTGTNNEILIRQDSCRMRDTFMSECSGITVYFTGSKSEGLELPGSDDDFMYEINNIQGLQVKTSLSDVQHAGCRQAFLMETDNVRPGFALLRSLNNMIDTELMKATQIMNGIPYLSSSRYVQNAKEGFLNFHSHGAFEATSQGPSVETNFVWVDKSNPGVDNVNCIHCPFWPDAASEWVTRPRRSRWPASADIKTIIDFGFHLVPIAHPLSDLNNMEWRISFSVAERTLVWSFNHVQMQCYAVMKLLLKEFIKINCKSENYILCSYFIKTFLFWKFEERDISLWQRRNFRECLQYLLREFVNCLREGVLRHYFFPRFNLLEIKLTPEAQSELLQLFDVIIHHDISVMGYCTTLSNVWSKFIHYRDTSNNIKVQLQKLHVLNNDATMMEQMFTMLELTHSLPNYRVFDTLLHANTGSCKTSLMYFVTRHAFFYKMFSFISLMSKSPSLNRKNKVIYDMIRHFNKSSCDISTCKLLKATMFLMLGDYITSLHVVNDMLSSIPPYAFYFSGGLHTSQFNTELYMDFVINSGHKVRQRAKESWLFDLKLNKRKHISFMPAAIQIELLFSDDWTKVWLSPYTCAYYLMFLCYHGLGQYQNRDRALQLLVEVATDDTRCGKNRHRSYNIAGHCLWYVGEDARARDMFSRSCNWSSRHPEFDVFNSARHYLQML